MAEGRAGGRPSPPSLQSPTIVIFLERWSTHLIKVVKFLKYHMYISASGLVVKSNGAIVGPRVQFLAGALYVLCIRRHGTDMSQKPTFGCVMLVPLTTRFCTMSPTCRPTCCRHIGPDISCLTFWTSGRHADIRHIPTKLLRSRQDFHVHILSNKVLNAFDKDWTI